MKCIYAVVCDTLSRFILISMGVMALERRKEREVESEGGRKRERRRRETERGLIFPYQSLSWERMTSKRLEREIFNAKSVIMIS